jgi:hypothetical protein
VHGIVPGGGLSLDGALWVACRPGFFLPVRVLSRRFRRVFLAKLADAYHAGRLRFFGDHQALADTRRVHDWLKPLGQIEWVVYANRPVAGPAAVLAYLSRYTHRVAIANSRLVGLDARGVTFRWKDYRAKKKDRYKTMTLAPGEFIRRFLLHVLPAGFHRIRHYGLLANTGRREQLAKARERLLCDAEPTRPERTEQDAVSGDADHPQVADPTPFLCPDCGAPMLIIDFLARGHHPRDPPAIRKASG